jgi:UDP-N-acetylglucosamine 2-epimerase (non-hydrolysing)
VNHLAALHDVPVVLSTHPRTRKQLEAQPALAFDQRVMALKPLGFFDYIRLQMQALCVLSDSGTVTEEAAILGFPAVTMRQAHERPEGMDEGTLIMADLVEERVADAVRVVTDHAWREGIRMRAPPDYDSELVSRKVVRLILSYTDYVRRTVWFQL